MTLARQAGCASAGSVRFAGVLLVVPVGGTAWSASNDAPRYLDDAISGADRMLAAADSVSDEGLDELGADGCVSGAGGS